MVVVGVGAGTAAQAFALPTLLVANVVGERLAMFKHVSQNVRNARHHVAVSSQPRLLPPAKAGL